MSILVSLDVETTGPAPAVGELCTIGAVAFDEATLEPVGKPFYIRLQAGGLNGWRYEDATSRGGRTRTEWSAPRRWAAARTA